MLPLVVTVYSSKLWPTAHHTFPLLHFTPFQGKSDNVENFVGIYFWLLIPPLSFKTGTNHSPYFHSTAFWSISGQIRQCWKFGQNSPLATLTYIILQNCGQPLSILLFLCILICFKVNQKMLKIWLEFIFSHSSLCYSSKLWPTTQHTFILLHFTPFQGESDNVEYLVRIHL